MLNNFHLVSVPFSNTQVWYRVSGEKVLADDVLYWLWNHVGDPHEGTGRVWYNFTNTVSSSGLFAFAEASDAVLFKLTWGGQ